MFDTESESKHNTDGEQKESATSEHKIAISPEPQTNTDGEQKESATPEHKTGTSPEPQTNEATQIGFASVYQAEEDDNVAEYDRFNFIIITHPCNLYSLAPHPSFIK